MHYERVRDVAKINDFVDVLQPVAFPDWPSIALLRCRYHVATYDDQQFERLAVAWPQEFLRATVKRKAEFLSGRYLARQLLEANDQVPDVPIGSHRQPLWPSGWVGSITHSNGCAISALAPSSRVSVLGIDLEHWLEDTTADKISAMIVDSEEAEILAGPMSYGAMLTFAFSAKESLFKAIFPLVGYYFDFDLAKLRELNFSAGTFTVEIAKDLSETVLAGDVFRGNFIAYDDSVLTLVAVTSSQ